MIVVEDGKQGGGRVDYVMRIKVNSETQPVAVALLEARAESLPRPSPHTGIVMLHWLCYK